MIELRNVAVFHSAKPGSSNPKKRGEMVVSGVNLTVCEGEMVYFIGKVGSGKSSLIKTLYAEVPLVEGEGRIVGFDLRRMKRRDISRPAAQHRHRLSGLPAPLGQGRVRQPALRHEGHRVEERNRHAQTHRGGALRRGSGEQGVQDAFRTLRAASSSVWPWHAHWSTIRA